LVDGALVPQDILQFCGERELFHYLLREIQNVYRLQGVMIDDKHVEVIISQMMRRVRVSNPGDTEFLPGSIVNKFRLYRVNDEIKKKGGQMAEFEALLLGITKASLQSDSFISAASFQETTKVLTEAALAGKVDDLKGLKENVILGHLIPAGTGFQAYQMTAVKKDSPGPWEAEAKKDGDGAPIAREAPPDDEDE
ncbi:MAG: DNA-directed RNA polymerase subunit beta', partial [Planctomycetes bacterium]|nr:DNA-directed RNA polymerase subunit beta' [Planctomycetota bacterium]